MTHSSRALENREERQVPHLNSHNKYNWRNNATDDVYCKLRIWFEGQTGIIDFAVDTETDLQDTVLFQFWYIVMMVILMCIGNGELQRTVLYISYKRVLFYSVNE